MLSRPESDKDNDVVEYMYNFPSLVTDVCTEVPLSTTIHHHHTTTITTATSYYNYLSTYAAPTPLFSFPFFSHHILPSHSTTTTITDVHTSCSDLIFFLTQILFKCRKFPATNSPKHSNFPFVIFPRLEEFFLFAFHRQLSAIICSPWVALKQNASQIYAFLFCFVHHS